VARNEIRERLGLTEEFVVTYSGSVGGWYLTEEMADFFAVAIGLDPRTHALWLTPSRHDWIRSVMNQRGVDPARYSVISARPDEVAGYLSASDAGLAFIKPCFSKLASSPTKNAEYLGCGLPVIINSGVGDSDQLITEFDAGELVTSLDRNAYQKAFDGVKDRTRDVARVREHNRKVAGELFNVKGIGLERYKRLYERLLGSRAIMTSTESIQSQSSTAKQETRGTGY
jgi:hypothetical protein